MSGSRAICIDFEPGIPGREIAAQVAQCLQLPLLDAAIMTRAAARLNFSARTVISLEREPDHPIERWFLAAGEGDQSLGLVGPTTVQSDPWMQPRRPLMQAISQAVKELAIRPCVIAGHDGAYALHDLAGVVRVFLRAAHSCRQRWLDQEREGGCAEPKRMVDRVDAGKRAYIRQAYGRPWPDPRIYHFMIDVGGLRPEQSGRLVAEYAMSVEQGQVVTR